MALSGLRGALTQEGRPARLPGVPVTRVVTLKGRIGEYGPRLEHAPADLLYCGRINRRGKNRGGWNLGGSPFANRHSVKKHGLAGSLARFVQDVIDHPELVEEIREHAGGILGCWCGDDPGIDQCHAAILAWVSDGGDPRHLVSRCSIWRPDIQIERIPAAGECEPDMPLLPAWENVVPRGAWAGAL